MAQVPRLSRKSCVMDGALIERFGHHNGWPEPERKQEPEYSAQHPGIVEGGELLPQHHMGIHIRVAVASHPMYQRAQLCETDSGALSLDWPPYVRAGTAL